MHATRRPNISQDEAKGPIPRGLETRGAFVQEESKKYRAADKNRVTPSHTMMGGPEESDNPALFSSSLPRQILQTLRQTAVAHRARALREGLLFAHSPKLKAS